MNRRGLLNIGALLPADLPLEGGGVPPVPTPPVPKTFTQAELEAHMAKERSTSQRAARDALLAEFGVTSKEEAAALLTAARTAADAQKTEQQRLTDAAAAAKVEADRDRAAVAAERLAMTTERALIRAGVPLEVEQDGKQVPNPQLAYALRLVTVEPGADAAAVEAAVAQVKADFPQMFAAQAAPPAVPSQGGPLRPPRNPGTPPADPQAMAAQARKEFGYQSRTGPAGNS